MPPLLVLLGIAAVIAAFPALRCLVKRIICARRLIRLCRQRSYSLIPTHPHWFLGHRHARNCDCYIETPNEIFAVKLFGVPRRACVLVFREDGSYFLRRFLTLMMLANFTFNGKPKPALAYQFRCQFRNAWEIKTPHRVLLVNPTPMEIRRQPHRGPEYIVGAGDTVCGMEIQTLSRLLGALENAL